MAGSSWTDVVSHPAGGFVRATSYDGAIEVFGGGIAWRQEVPTDFLRFIRLAISPAGDQAFVVGIGLDGNGYAVTKGGASVFSPANTENGVAVTHDGNKFVLYAQNGPRSYVKDGVEFPMELSSQGFQDVFPDGRIVFGDQTVTEFKLPGGHSLWRRTERGDYIAGMTGDNHLAVFKRSTGEFYKGPEIVGGVRLAVSGTTFAVAAFGRIGAIHEEHLVFPKSEQPVPVPTPPPTPTPTPTPTPEPPKPMIPKELEDQFALVEQVRNELFPDKIGQPLKDGEKAALWAKHVAWRLRHLGVGLAKAKPGSDNRGGACPEAPEGITTDIVALANGVHWDIQQDGHTGDAFPRWALEENPANYPPIAGRFIPAVEPPGVKPAPKPEPQPEPLPEPVEPSEPTEPEETPGDLSGLVDLLTAAIVEKLTPVIAAEVDKLRAELELELNDLTFVGSNRFLGTITFKRK